MAAVPRWPSPAILDIIEPQIAPFHPPTPKPLPQTWSRSDAPFARSYPPLNYTVTLKLRFGVTQGQGYGHFCISKMAVSRHLGFYRTANSAIRSAEPENPSLEPNIEWIGCTVCEIFAFIDLETGVRGHSRSSKTASFDRAHTILYSSSIVTMPLSLTVSEI